MVCAPATSIGTMAGNGPSAAVTGVVEMVVAADSGVDEATIDSAISVEFEGAGFDSSTAVESGGPATLVPAAAKPTSREEDAATISTRRRDMVPPN